MISDTFLKALLSRIATAEVLGIGLTGSFARGEENLYSDVDLDIFVSRLPQPPSTSYNLQYWDPHLVSLSYFLLEEQRAAFSKPERAIWIIPALQRMEILMDKDGSLAAIRKDAQNFEWQSLQSAADQYAAEQIMGCAEEVHKILGGLMTQHESTVLNAVWGLVEEMLRAVAVQRGLMIPSENLYLELLQEALGRKSEWTQAFRTAWGLEPVPGGLLQFQARGAAALRLYRCTARMFRPLIAEENRAVVENSLNLIEAAGY